MKASIIALFACFFLLGLDASVAYSALPSPPPRVAATLTVFPSVSTVRIPSTTGKRSHGELQMSGWQRIFRRGKKKVQTLERESDIITTTKKKKEPEPLWRVMFHNSEYMPDRVALVLASIFPTLDRRAAFELCTRARSMGKVAVVITSKKQAEFYCMALNRQGLTATIEPHVDAE